jgi:hypothetical protein
MTLFASHISDLQQSVVEKKSLNRDFFSKL